jgi:hypothetical protein
MTWTAPNASDEKITAALVASFLGQLSEAVRTGKVVAFAVSWEGGYEIRSTIRHAGAIEQIVLSGVDDEVD